MRKSSRKSAKVSSGERRYADCRNGLGIEAICWMLVRKERKRKVHSLIDKVWNWKNLNEAWKKVKNLSNTRIRNDFLKNLGLKSLSTNLSLEKKALPKKQGFLVKVFAKQKSFEW